jgi:hypothetical protein
MQRQCNQDRMRIRNEGNENGVLKYPDYQDVAPITLPYEAFDSINHRS